MSPSSSAEESMAAFAASHVAPRREEWLRPGQFPRDLWATMGEAGLLGLATSAEFGGAGGGYAALIGAGEALVRAGGNLGVASSWLSHCLTGRFFVEGFAGPEHRALWLPLIARGTATVAVAISEPGAGAHPKHLKATARRSAEGWRLDGEKAYVTNGPIAAAFVVLAVSAVEAGRKRFSAFLVPRDTPGLTLIPGAEVDFLRPAPHCGLRLEGCVVSGPALIGVAGEAFEAMSIPFRAVEDAVAAGKMVSALRHLIDGAAKAAPPFSAGLRDALAAELGALAGLAAVLEAVAIDMPAALAGDTVQARLIGFRLVTRMAVERLHALPDRHGFAWSAAAAMLLRDIDKSLDIAKGPRATKQTRLGLTLLDQPTT
jgi:alkylation response protein AidB-like acyl-CoA dehydrogenase